MSVISVSRVERSFAPETNLSPLSRLIRKHNLQKNVCIQKSVSVYVCAYVGVTANSVHPGVVMTEVMRHYSLMIRCIFNFIGVFFFKVSTLLHFIAFTVQIISQLPCHYLCRVKYVWLLFKNLSLKPKNTH